MIKERKYIYWGILFLIIQILAIIRNLSSDYFSFFWYCDFTAGIFAVLFFLKKDQAIKGLLNIGLFGQLAYTLILIYKLIFGVSLFGFIFQFSGFFQTTTTLILHLSTILVLFANYKVKPKKTSLLYSLAFLILIYSVVLIFTSPNFSILGNYNFIYYSKSLSPHVPYYTQLWILLGFVLVVLPTYWFQILLYKFFKRKKLVKIKSNN